MLVCSYNPAYGSWLKELKPCSASGSSRWE